MYMCVYIYIHIYICHGHGHGHLNTSYRKAHALPPSCPDCYADLFRAPLHEVLPKPSPPL